MSSYFDHDQDTLRCMRQPFETPVLSLRAHLLHLPFWSITLLLFFSISHRSWHGSHQYGELYNSKGESFAVYIPLTWNFFFFLDDINAMQKTTNSL